jgi:hypothetical protein
MMVMLKPVGFSVVADYCASAGAYHLSCYADSISSNDAQAAKAQCFSEWAKYGHKPYCHMHVGR